MSIGSAAPPPRPPPNPPKAPPPRAHSDPNSKLRGPAGAAAPPNPPRPATAGALSVSFMPAGFSWVLTSSIGMKKAWSGPFVPVVLPSGFTPHCRSWLAM